MKRSVAKALSVISAIAAIVIAMVFIPSGNEAAITAVFLVYLPIAIWLNYCQRCKHCGRWPRRGDFFDTYCPGCGQPYED